MADVLRLAHKYAKMDDFLASHPPGALAQRIGRLQDRLPDDASARGMAMQEIETLRDQLRTVERMEASRADFRERLALLARSMENLRHRIAAVRARPSEDAWRSAQVEEVLVELDTEFEVFEETFEVMQS